MPVDPEMVCAVMRHWPTGVVILTSRRGAQTHGMKVNSFTSISLEPPLVPAWVERIVRTHALADQLRIFANSLLREGQAWISPRFAGRDIEAQGRFPGLCTYAAVTGTPVLADNLGHLDCAVNADLVAGDHAIFVAEVGSAAVGSARATAGADSHDQAAIKPLPYFDRSYHCLD